jgi:hypothetical protein
MATDNRPHPAVNDEEETILSTHARAAELADAVQAAKSQIEGRARRRHAWIAIAVIVALLAGLALL